MRPLTFNLFTVIVPVEVISVVVPENVPAGPAGPCGPTSPIGPLTPVLLVINQLLPSLCNPTTSQFVIVRTVELEPKRARKLPPRLVTVKVPLILLNIVKLALGLENELALNRFILFPVSKYTVTKYCRQSNSPECTFLKTTIISLTNTL